MPTQTDRPVQQAPAQSAPQPEPTPEEVRRERKAALNLAARLEQERRDELEEAMEAHSRLVSKLRVASEALVQASAEAEGLQRLLKGKRFLREASVGRRLRVDEVVRTVNAARMHVSKIHAGSEGVGRATRDSVDELIRPHEGPAFG